MRLPSRPRLPRWSAQFLRLFLRSISQSTREFGWALRKTWRLVFGGDISLLQAQLARREWKPSASATGPPDSDTSRLRFRTTLAASRSVELSSSWPWASPPRKSRELRIGQARLGTTSKLGSGQS